MSPHSIRKPSYSSIGSDVLRIPVVASNVCAIPEAIESGVNGILVEPQSIEKLADSICLLLEDTKLRQKIGKNARKTVLEKFDWKVNAFRTTDLFNRILTNELEGSKKPVENLAY